ncbi:MAG: cytochrome c [Bacteroidetes bacterium]|nr:cytochrome c [Bacteroidota bacterium]
MTNAQKWVAAFLGLFLILFLLGRLTMKEESSTPPMMMGQMANQQAQVSDDADGPTLVKQLGCISCHGDNLQGTNIGPALANIKEHWTRDALINYLRNPSAYSGDARFQQYREQFKNVVMPSFNNMDVKQLGKIADYLLTR